MTPWPWHKFEIRTRLTLQQARAALAAHVEEVKWFRWTMPSSANDKRFTGRVEDDSFEIRRILGYRNSFAPMSRGTISTVGRGARIDVRMTLHPFVAVFIGVWSTGVLFALVAFATAGSERIYALLPLLMLAFLYAMTLLAFWFEANKQERALREIFQAI